MSETQITSLVREGKLREFRDGGKTNYRVDDVDKLRKAAGLSDDSPSEASGSGELILEPADDSGIDLAGSAGDAISLAETDLEGTATGEEPAKKDKKDDTVVTSVGVSVFEEDDGELAAVDPVAETVISEGGLGIEGVGSGSGLLDLTRESDDTSLGAELLDEIYPADSGDVGEMGDDTRAGLEEIVPEVEEAEEAEAIEPVAVSVPETTVVTRVEFAPDAWSAGVTGLMAVTVLVMCVSGLSVAAVLRGAVPSLLESLYPYLWAFGAGAVVLAGVAAAVGYFLGKRTE
jgi:hypothetical protein